MFWRCDDAIVSFNLVDLVYFQFFLKATKLEKIKHDYWLANNARKISADTIREKRSVSYICSKLNRFILLLFFVKMIIFEGIFDNVPIFWQIIPNLESKCEKQKRIYEQMMSVKTAKEKKQKLNHELAWSLVNASKKVKGRLHSLM